MINWIFNSSTYFKNSPNNQKHNWIKPISPNNPISSVIPANTKSYELLIKSNFNISQCHTLSKKPPLWIAFNEWELDKVQVIHQFLNMVLPKKENR